MGVPQLWQVLKKAGTVQEVESHAQIVKEVEDKMIAVDLATWLVQACTQQDLAAAYGNSKSLVLKIVFERTLNWLRYGCVPVFVKEGRTPAEKLDLISKRYGIPTGSGYTGNKAGGWFDQLGAIVFAMLEAMGIPTFEAAGEGEATCAALAACGYVDGCCTTDVDALLFGAPVVYKELHLHAATPKKSRITMCRLADVQRVLGISNGGSAALVAMAQLSGGDYNTKGAEGVGSTLALRGIATLLKKHESDEEILRLLADALGRGPDPELLKLGKCTGCKQCMHDTGGKSSISRHGKEGCVACGTRDAQRKGSGCGGCTPYEGELREWGSMCECKFHKMADERWLAKVIDRAHKTPGFMDSCSKAVGGYVKQAKLAHAHVQQQMRNRAARLSWQKRPDVQRLSVLLSEHLPEWGDKMRSKLLPFLLEWDVRWGPDRGGGTEFRPCSIIKLQGKTATADGSNGKTDADSGAADGKEEGSEEGISPWRYVVTLEARDMTDKDKVACDLQWIKEDALRRMFRKTLLDRVWPDLVQDFNRRLLAKAQELEAKEAKRLAAAAAKDAKAAAGSQGSAVKSRQRKTRVDNVLAGQTRIDAFMRHKKVTASASPYDLQLSLGTSGGCSAPDLAGTTATRSDHDRACGDTPAYAKGAVGSKPIPVNQQSQGQPWGLKSVPIEVVDLEDPSQQVPDPTSAVAARSDRDDPDRSRSSFDRLAGGYEPSPSQLVDPRDPWQPTQDLPGIVVARSDHAGASTSAHAVRSDHNNSIIGTFTHAGLAKCCDPRSSKLEDQGVPRQSADQVAVGSDLDPDCARLAGCYGPSPSQTASVGKLRQCTADHTSIIPTRSDHDHIVVGTSAAARPTIMSMTKPLPQSLPDLDGPKLARSDQGHMHGSPSNSARLVDGLKAEPDQVADIGVLQQPGDLRSFGRLAPEKMATKQTEVVLPLYMRLHARRANQPVEPAAVRSADRQSGNPADLADNCAADQAADNAAYCPADHAADQQEDLAPSSAAGQHEDLAASRAADQQADLAASRAADQQADLAASRAADQQADLALSRAADQQADLAASRQANCRANPPANYSAASSPNLRTGGNIGKANSNLNRQIRVRRSKKSPKNRSQPPKLPITLLLSPDSRASIGIQYKGVGVISPCRDVLHNNLVIQGHMGDQMQAARAATSSCRFGFDSFPTTPSSKIQAPVISLVSPSASEEGAQPDTHSPAKRHLASGDSYGGILPETLSPAKRYLHSGGGSEQGLLPETLSPAKGHLESSGDSQQGVSPETLSPAKGHLESVRGSELGVSPETKSPSKGHLESGGGSQQGVLPETLSPAKGHLESGRGSELGVSPETKSPAKGHLESGGGSERWVSPETKSPAKGHPNSGGDSDRGVLPETLSPANEHLESGGGSKRGELPETPSPVDQRLDSDLDSDSGGVQDKVLPETLSTLKSHLIASDSSDRTSPKTVSTPKRQLECYGSHNEVPAETLSPAKRPFNSSASHVGSMPDSLPRENVHISHGELCSNATNIRRRDLLSELSEADDGLGGGGGPFAVPPGVFGAKPRGSNASCVASETTGAAGTIVGNVVVTKMTLESGGKYRGSLPDKSPDVAASKMISGWDGGPDQGSLPDRSPNVAASKLTSGWNGRPDQGSLPDGPPHVAAAEVISGSDGKRDQGNLPNKLSNVALAGTSTMVAGALTSSKGNAPLEPQHCFGQATTGSVLNCSLSNAIDLCSPMPSAAGPVREKSRQFVCEIDLTED